MLNKRRLKARKAAKRLKERKRRKKKAVTDRVSQEPLWLLGQLKKNNFQHAQLRRDIYGIKSVVKKPVSASF